MCLFGSSYQICMIITRTSLYLTTSWPIYQFNEYLGSINFYRLTMCLNVVLALIIIGYCYNMNIMILNMQFLLEWSHNLIKWELWYSVSTLWNIEMRHILLAPTLIPEISKWKVQPCVALDILIQNPWFSTKITIRMTSYSEKGEGLGVIMGGSITY